MTTLSVHDHSILFGWILLAAAVVVFCASRAIVGVAPLGIAAVILAVVGIRHGRTAGGMLLLVATLLLPAFLLVLRNAGG